MRGDGDGGRVLGAFDIGCVVVGGIIGVGIFFTPAQVAKAVDTPAQVILAWGLGGLLAVLGGLVFAELSTLVPGHGGMFVYILRAFGRVPAFLYGWANWLIIQAGALGIVGLILAEYLGSLLYGAAGGFSDGERLAIAVAACLLFTAVNVMGLRLGKGVQNGLTVLKVLAVFVLVVLGLLVGAGGDDVPVEAAPSSGRSLPAMLQAAMLPVLFSFGGWQQGSFLAGAARRPLRDVPLGILGGVVVVVLAYVTVNLAFLDLLGFERAREARAIGADAAAAALGPYGWGEVAGRVFAAMVVVSAAGIMNTICLAPPFVLQAMARAGVFPATFARLHPRTGSPIPGVLGQGLWAAVLLVLVHLTAGDTGAQDRLDYVLNGVVFVDWLFFALCGLALLRLRRTAPPGAFRAPLGNAVALAFLLGALAVTIGSLWRFPTNSAACLAVILLGPLVCLRFLLRPASGEAPGA